MMRSIIFRKGGPRDATLLTSRYRERLPVENNFPFRHLHEKEKNKKRKIAYRDYYRRRRRKRDFNELKFNFWEFIGISSSCFCACIIYSDISHGAGGGRNFYEHECAPMSECVWWGRRNGSYIFTFDKSDSAIIQISVSVVCDEEFLLPLISNFRIYLALKWRWTNPSRYLYACSLCDRLDDSRKVNSVTFLSVELLSLSSGPSWLHPGAFRSSICVRWFIECASTPKRNWKLSSTALIFLLCSYFIIQLCNWKWLQKAPLGSFF